jgi:hypothetical protein
MILNPRCAKFVTSHSAPVDQTPQDYIYSSASNYIENTGLLKVTLADNPVMNTLNLSNIHKMNSFD